MSDYKDVNVAGAYMRKDKDGNPIAFVVKDVDGNVYMIPYTGSSSYFDSWGGAAILQGGAQA